MKRFIFAIILACCAPASLVFAADTDAAKALFEQYVRLEHGFDPAVAELYADDALVRNKRTYPDGQIRELTFPVAQYRALIKLAMPVAKARGDTSTYTAVTFTQEGAGVRIRATRFSNLKGYSSPISLLVSPGPGGRWLIREELSESQP